MKGVSDISFREIQKTYFMFDNFFFENFAVYEIMCTAGQATDDNMAQVRCMLFT
jgi:hypothetical protein